MSADFQRLAHGSDQLELDLTLGLNVVKRGRVGLKAVQRLLGQVERFRKIWCHLGGKRDGAHYTELEWCLSPGRARQLGSEPFQKGVYSFGGVLEDRRRIRGCRLKRCLERADR